MRDLVADDFKCKREVTKDSSLEWSTTRANVPKHL
jgi:hypothetical protein